MSGERRTYFAEYMRKKRARWIRAGLCSACGKEPATEGMRTGPECRGARKTKDEARGAI